MKQLLKVSYWLLPVLGFGLGLAWANIRFHGLLETWQLVGKPDEKIVQVLGVREDRKILVVTETGGLYSFEFGKGDGVALPAQPVWEKEPLDSVDPVSHKEREAGFLTWPPLFPVQQLVEREYVYKVEGVGLVKFALAADGNVWMWFHQNAGLARLMFYFYPVMGLVIGLAAALLIGLGRRIYRKNPSMP